MTPLSSLPSTTLPSSSPEPRRLVVIATYNERDNITELISEITSLKPSFQVLVVDDNSPDGTGDAVAELDEKLGNFSVAIGSRYLGGIRILNWSLGRLLLSLGANQYVRVLLRLKYTDCTSGFRAYRQEVIQELLRHKVNSRGYAFLVEILNQIKRAGYQIGEVPITYTERRAGQSKMSKMTIWEAAWRPWLILFTQLLRRRRR